MRNRLPALRTGMPRDGRPRGHELAAPGGSGVTTMMVGDSMMIGMGLVWLLSIVVIALVGAAAIKYLFFHPTGRGRRNADDGRASGRTPP
jgi:hypothetical protein